MSKSKTKTGTGSPRQVTDPTSAAQSQTESKRPEPLIDPTFLFRFEVQVRSAKMKWTTKGLDLPESCRLPSFGGLSGRPVYADVRMGWSDEGIGVQVAVNGNCRGAVIPVPKTVTDFIFGLIRDRVPTFTERPVTVIAFYGCHRVVAPNAKALSREWSPSTALAITRTKFQRT